MRFPMWSIAVLGVSLALAGCGKDNDANNSGATKLGITSAAMAALPQVSSGAPLMIAKTGINGSVNILAALDPNSFPGSFFKFECHMGPNNNFCPSTITVNAEMDPADYKFTSTTLLGSIYHGEMYMGGYHSTCEDTAATISTSSFAAANTGEDPTKFMVDNYALLTCKKRTVEESQPSWNLYSADPAGTYQASLATKYHMSFNGDTSNLQTFFIQGYAALAEGKASVVAYNSAGVSSMFNRAVLLFNKDTHRFAIKYLAPGGSGDNNLVAVGVGGVSPTGDKYPGYFAMTYVANGVGPSTICVNNETNAYTIDMTACAGIPQGWGSADDIKTYLGVDATHALRMNGFVAKFGDSSLLGAGDAPTVTNDAEVNFPKEIQ